MVCVTVVALSGCASSRAWRDARRTHTPNGYAAFVAESPDHRKVRKATRRHEELNWALAQTADASEAYWGYVGAHSQGPHAEEARERAEALAWSETRAAASIESLTVYLARYATSPHRAEADALLEIAWVDEARGEDNEAVWRRYLVRYPQGQHVAEARERLSELSWLRTVETDTPAAYVRFLERFPSTAHAEAAQIWLAGLRVAELQPVVRLLQTWQPEAQRSTVVARVRRELERGLLVDLKRDFTVRPVQTDDVGSKPGATAVAPQETFGIEPGVGLLVVEYRESEGRTFDPAGRATDIRAHVSLYAPTTPKPVWSRTLETTTPGKIYGSTESILHTSAVAELGSLMRGVDFPVEGHRIK